MKPAKPLKIVMVPLDDRPCTAYFPRRIAGILRQDLCMPPAEILGRFLTPGDPAAARAWLSRKGPGADYVIASLEMLCYGGLIASRECRASVDEAGEALNVLRQVKQASPVTQVFASSVIMRTSITARDDRTAVLWRDMNRRSVLQYKRDHGLLSRAEARELEELTARIPGDVLDGYLRARARNHEINLSAVRAVACGSIDFLLLCQEDSHPWGPHRDEQERLLQLIETLGVGDRVAICCGTDEAGMLLLARALNTGYSSRPQIVPVYYPDDAGSNVPLYEDRPVSENVTIHMKAIGAEALGPEDLVGAPHAVCLVHCPDRDPVDVWSAGASHATSRAPAEGSDGPRVTPHRSCGSVPGPGPGSGCGSGDRVGAGTIARGDGNVHVAGCIQEGRPGPGPSPGPSPVRTLGAVRTEDDLLQALSAWRATDTPVGVVDARLANGADPGFLALLSRGAGLLNLAAYAGWNTAANSLGTVLAHLSAYLIAVSLPDSQVDWAVHYGFLVERFLDDFVYQTRVRPELVRIVLGRPELGSIHCLSAEGLRAVNDALTRFVSDEAATFFTEHVRHRRFRIAGRGGPGTCGAGARGVLEDLGFRVDLVGLEARLPWDRLFEVEVRASVAVSTIRADVGPEMSAAGEMTRDGGME